MRRFCLPGFPLLVAAVWFALVRLTAADTVILKSGEKIEGKITSETPTEIIIDYKATPTINDTRTIPRADIDKIEKESPEELTYQKLKALKPGPNGYELAAYDRIVGALEGFLQQFPQTKHKDEIAKAAADFKEEKSRIEAGEVKIGGKWFTKEEAQQERYQLAAGVLFGQMQDLARQGRTTDALNLFEQLEKQYPGAYAYPDAAEFARQLVTNLKPQAERALEQWKQTKAEREKANQLASEADRIALVAAQKKEQEQGDAAVDAVEKNRTAKWVPLIRNEKALNKIIQMAPNEQRRLETLPIQKMRESIQLSEQARVEIKEDPAAAEKTIRQATSLWNANEVAQRLGKRAAELVMAAKATPVPEATPAPTATPAASPAGTPAAGSGTPGASPSAQPATSTEPAAAPEEKEPFYTSITFAVSVIIVLILVFGGLNFYRRMQEKKALDESSE